MTVRVTLQGADYQNGDQVRARVDQLVERLRALPGVTAIGVGSILPLGGLGALNDFAVDGAPPPPPNVNQEIAVASASPDYFKAIGAPLKRGRLFNDLDQPSRRRWRCSTKPRCAAGSPDEDPIGKRVLSGGPREVVGIVGDVLQRTPGQPAAPQMFLPYTQRTGRIGPHHRPRRRAIRSRWRRRCANRSARSIRTFRSPRPRRSRRWCRDRWRGRGSTCRC